MRQVILGATGKLACDLAERLGGAAISLARQQADLTEPATLRQLLQEGRPDIVFNCAAYNFVDRAEEEPPVAFAVNAFGVRDLALACRDLDCVLVHFSSDYVFGLDTARREPYLESDCPGPISVYGSSKLAGEYFARSICPKHFVIRTCGLYGLKGSGGKKDSFVEKMLRLAEQNKTLRVVSDQICSPSYTADIAEAAVRLVATGKFGLYHLTNAGGCSWYEFAKSIFEIQGLEIEVKPIMSGEFRAAARRPSYSVLAMRALEQVGLNTPRRWKEALRSYLQARGSAKP
jgi:dTDP-4-dehydrorhamnose reductase